MLLKEGYMEVEAGQLKEELHTNKEEQMQRHSIMDHTGVPQSWPATRLLACTSFFTLTRQCGREKMLLTTQRLHEDPDALQHRRGRTHTATEALPGSATGEVQVRVGIKQECCGCA